MLTPYLSSAERDQIPLGVKFVIIYDGLRLFVVSLNSVEIRTQNLHRNGYVKIQF